MQSKRTENRKQGLALIGAGIVLALVGIGLCWGVYLIMGATRALFYAIGIFGALVTFGGLALSYNGICQALTGKTDSEARGTLTNGGPELDQRG